MAENILSWQDNGTGWPLMSTVREPFTGDMSKAGPWGKKAALVKASLNEMRFLARGYTATKDERYKTAVLGGLNYILEAQLESGAWPHTYPYDKSTYHSYATYNDDVIPDIMTFLNEVATDKDFEMVGDDNRQRVKDAYEKGLEFILKSQIVVDGKKTAWAQQYDEETLEPKPARTFEPAAISGGESATVLHFLMDIRNPSPEVIEAVKAGVQWYRDVQINGLELVRTEDDKMVKPNKKAPPIWARYYEIGTNRPIFAGRDGIIRYQMAEVEKERRGGYSWYNYNGTGVFKRYEEWLHERKWDDQPTTNTEEAKVGTYTLPEILRLENGKQVKSVAKWEKKRRPEIMRLFEQYQYGKTPKKSIKLAYEVIEDGASGMGGKSKRTQFLIKFPEHPDMSPIHVVLNVPANAEGPVPTLLHISFSPNVTRYEEPGIYEGMAWDRKLKVQVPATDVRSFGDTKPEHYIDHGYGIATVYYGDIEPDFKHDGKYGVRSLFGTPENREPDSWGSIGAWSWGLSRILDYLETHPAVDGEKVALSGVSRLGKTVGWAVAQDKRFAMAIPLVSGEGGAAISRRNFGETVADLTKPSRYPYWFAPRYSDYAFKVDELPVDAHMVLAMIAPRPVLQVVGISDTWSDPIGEWEAAKAASPVYELYGLKGMADEPKPEPGDQYLHDMGFFMHDDGHTVIQEDYEVITKFMDKHFK